MVVDEREQQIINNLGLVHTIANRFRSRGADYDDLFQAGCIGLIKAVDNFDSEKGFQFSTYAVPVIIGEIKRIFRDGGPIKISRSLKEKAVRVQYLREKYLKDNNREPTMSELSELSGIETGELSEVINAVNPVVSLNMSNEDGDEEYDIPYDNYEDVFDRIVIKELTSRLSEKEKSIIQLRYFEGKTQMQTAKALNISQVQVSRREKAILTKLRNTSN